MKFVEWDERKNEKLKRERDICFEEILLAIIEQRILAVVEHPNKKRYGHQKVLIVKINHYAYLVPYVENENAIFLKTIIPSRKATKQCIIRKPRLSWALNITN